MFHFCALGFEGARDHQACESLAAKLELQLVVLERELNNDEEQLFLQSRTANKQRTMKRKRVQLEAIWVYQNSTWELHELPMLTADHLGNTQGGTMCEDDETTSMSTGCLRGDLSSSDDDEISRVELKVLEHEEIDEDVARHAAAHPHPQRKSKFHRKLGGYGAHVVD
eukprot:5960971-Amphidinium_carterae.1